MCGYIINTSNYYPICKALLQQLG